MRGFILQPTYRIERGRPVVHLHGRLETGETFLVRDDREVPCFYILDSDVDRAVRLGATVAPEPAPEARGRTTMDGRPVARVELRLPAEAPQLRDRLQHLGIPCYEADVRFAMSFLISRGLRGAIEIDGDSTPGSGIDRVFENPELRPAPGEPALGGPALGEPALGEPSWAPQLRVLSFDIETDPKARRLLSIGLHGCGVSEVLLFCPRDYPAPSGAVPFRKERDLLRGFCRRLRELDPDVLTGWNVVDFDLRVLDRMAGRWKVPLEIGRGPGTLRLRESRGPWSQLEATVPGRVVLDGIQVLRGSFIRMEEYSLDSVAREVLGEGKTISGHDRAEEIVDTFLHDRDRFVEYNLTDARLVIEILEKLRLLDLSVERSLLTGMPINRVASSVAALDFLYLSELRRRGLVAPTVSDAPESFGGESGADTDLNLGGHVFEPEPGLYSHVLVFDFKSLYPSIIRTFQIDPLGYLPDPGPDDDPIVAPNGAAFRREPGNSILPRLIDELLPRREAAKRAGDAVTSHAIKILMNSFYGVLGTPACRFYRPAIASAITAFGRELLLWSKKRFESYGRRVLYGDTDSLFVLAGDDQDPGAAWELGRALAADLNRDLSRHVGEKWRVESRLELELERLYRRLLLPAMRHGRGGARKRYAGLVDEGAGAEVKFVGMESVRRDWTELAKRVQHELYERLFTDRETESYLRTTVEELRAGRLDDLLVYRKALRKKLDDYTATTPPHVAAARKMSGRTGRLISYVMTTRGAEPVAELRSPVDHEHYVQKQVRPVAEPVLAVLGLDFDRVVGDNAQLELF